MGSGSSKPSSSSDSYYKPTNTVYGSEITTTPYTPDSNNRQKRAILIGSNYKNTGYPLNGCVNDVNTMAQLFESWGFQITKMTDLSPGDLFPTKVNIINKLNYMVDTLEDFGTLVVYYSGHGSRVADQNGDEVSGKDSVIVPNDFNSQGVIVDDTIREILTRKPDADRNIFAIFDSCNSGSVCDLRYNYFATSYRQTPFIKQKTNTDPNLIPRTAYVENRNYLDTSTNIISLSGCKDDEYSYEMVSVGGISGGALTYALLKCLKTMTPNITFNQLLTDIRNTISGFRLNQNPSLMVGNLYLDPATKKVSEFLNI
jgi:hypothetical protein